MHYQRDKNENLEWDEKLKLTKILIEKVIIR